MNPFESSFFIQPTTEDEVEKYIETLKNCKTYGSSSLPNKLFKQFKKCLKIPLAKLANLTFEVGEFLGIQNTSKAVPIQKKDSKVDCNN